MSPAHVLAPTYQRLKEELMSGTYPAGAKLEALRLAEEYGVSMTPVRDSLNQLTGEGLVEFSPGDGFRVPRLTDQGLRDMLDVNHLLMVHALGASGTSGAVPRQPSAETHDYAARLAAVFESIASASGNRFLIRCVEQIGEKLGPARRIEPAVIPTASETLLRLEESLGRSPADRILALAAYRANCLEAVPRLVASVVGSN